MLATFRLRFPKKKKVQVPVVDHITLAIIPSSNTSSPGQIRNYQMSNCIDLLKHMLNVQYDRLDITLLLLPW
jgi:hypothetical protein